MIFESTTHVKATKIYWNCNQVVPALTFLLLKWVIIWNNFLRSNNYFVCIKINRSIRVKISDSFLPCDLEIWWWHWKILGHLFYTTPSLVHHFKAIGEFKLELQSGNTRFGSKSAIFLSRVTSKFEGWPWKTIGHLFYAASSFVHHFIAISELKLELESGITQFGSKSAISCPVWRWNLMDDL